MTPGHSPFFRQALSARKKTCCPPWASPCLVCSRHMPNWQRAWTPELFCLKVFLKTLPSFKCKQLSLSGYDNSYLFLNTPQTHSDMSPVLGSQQLPIDGVKSIDLPWIYFFPFNVHSMCQTLCQVLGLHREGQGPLWR